MQNVFTLERYAEILIQTRRAEARQEARLSMARAGQPRRRPGLALIGRIQAIRQPRGTSLTPACQPGMAC